MLKKKNSAELPICFSSLNELGTFYWDRGGQDEKIFIYETNFPTHAFDPVLTELTGCILGNKRHV